MARVMKVLCIAYLLIILFNEQCFSWPRKFDNKRVSRQTWNLSSLTMCLEEIDDTEDVESRWVKLLKNYKDGPKNKSSNSDSSNKESGDRRVTRQEPHGQSSPEETDNTEDVEPRWVKLLKNYKDDPKNKASNSDSSNDESGDRRVTRQAPHGQSSSEETDNTEDVEPHLVKLLKNHKDDPKNKTSNSDSSNDESGDRRVTRQAPHGQSSSEETDNTEDVEPRWVKLLKNHKDDPKNEASNSDSSNDESGDGKVTRQAPHGSVVSGRN